MQNDAFMHVRKMFPDLSSHRHRDMKVSVATEIKWVVFYRATITTRDGNYQHTIGQRKTLSFKDAKIINLQYCMGVCTRQLPCQNSGYTDPRECSECRCPEGYGGTFCENMAESTIPDCGGELNATSTYQTLQMEGDFQAPSGSSCAWRITVSLEGGYRSFYRTLLGRSM
ncbi:unnamed protein product [Anisakis simplex]|uniref:Zinc metalloproteinase nas-37 (inferred by orthology to a C. elegans protein) n=1 Tax=Anisakis simplex TaxID=6269 RepID=A0A0M3JFK3_ANISI|nr:unnamed protein product [Anisakis simplex]